MECDYKILGVRHTSMLSPLGGYVGAQEVTFTTGGQPPQKVTLPDSEFTDENVANAIQARCAVIHSVLNLGQ